MGGPQFQHIAAHAEAAALERLIVAPILLCDQIGDHLALVVFLPGDQILRHRAIGLDRADTVDARHRRHDDHIVAFQQRAGGRMAHPVDLFVNLAFLLDEGVGARHIGFGLIVIVVADKILDRVIGEEALELPV